MAARKLQTEIDRTLKKVAEGVEAFESLYEKMQASTNQTQKEKLELDLKTQIKKLQRSRDQIKTWVASNDIKDKSALLENRKLIETQMERFKACEKEMKTKAFSKEGLTQAAKLDPKEQEKEEAVQWLQTRVEELQMQVEQAEAEIESLQGTGKKRNKSSSQASRLEELEHLNERRKWHISRLEIVLRLLQNGSLSTEKVLGLQEDVSYFVESNTEEDFDEDEGIYDELNLDEEEEKFRGFVQEDDSDESDGVSEDLPPRTPKKHEKNDKHHDDESTTSSRRDDSPILKKAGINTQLRKGSVDAKSQTSITNILKSGTQHSPSTSSAPPARPPATLPIRYATAAAAAIAPQTTQTPQSSSVSSATPATSNSTSALPPAPSIPPSTSAQSQEHSVTPSSPSLTHPSVTSPMLSSASVSQQLDGSFYSSQESPTVSEAVPSSVGGQAAASSSPQRTTAIKDSAPSPTRAATQSPNGPLPSDPTHTSQPQVNGNAQASSQPTGPSLPQATEYHPSNTSVPAIGSPVPAMSHQTPQFPPGVKVAAHDVSVPSQASKPPATPQQVPQRTAPSALPGSISDLVVSFENAKQKAALRMTNNNLDQVHKMLEGGYSNIPQPQDTEKPKYYVPRNPFQTPSYYPQSPNPLLSTAAIFSQLDVETLFYVFYYLPGTYQQYLAAKELKRQSWRFHIKYLTWFQRHSEPQAITEEYEQGVYVYFDWEGSWCQRKKSDFRFEYRYLSED
ncbi:general negative regulator of transcription subunit 5 [Stygiomarasmius scandens]|uniref:General negative regulator of transcription subunit n=1 Tax=Marasmiellus scandens TaxID=2682957 RepID=A0ABR1K260_9AGAR